MIIQHGACALPGADEFRRLDIRVVDGRIVALEPALEPEAGEETIDAAGLQVFPGAIDPHVHFDEPGFTQREDFLHGSMAAARGGVTTVIDMPCTSLPPVTSLAKLRIKLAAMGQRSVVDFGLFGGVSGHRIEEALERDMAELAPEVLGFKCYLISGMDSFTAVDHFGLARALNTAARLGRPLLLHAEDPSYVNAATVACKARSVSGGQTATWDDYVESRPMGAELAAIAAAISYARPGSRNGGQVQADLRPWLHIVHVGTADAVELLAGFGQGASCETCPQYLVFSRDDFVTLGSALKTAPPVKEAGNAERLWQQLADGRIAFAASDHAPAPAAEKNSGSVWTDYGGIPGSGTLFPLLYSEGFRRGRLGLSALLRASCGAAAARYGLVSAKGSLAVGKDADLALVDPAATRTVRGDALLSKGTITPFEGMTLAGDVVLTMVRGRTVWDGQRATDERPDAGIVVAPGWGKQLRWGNL
ncbi:MAG: hypothetical protein A2087_04650 [Spirochaetes bacterium GWD1_61_31]|nr:MAG: hypothetical protein A2Y37_09225 [Spirochaetes bacterium GWB1_60_80]OHD32313.1 MAG: hypothetical protein A2004_11185 [Spirochaetes bacterium GWC1_61_12]OHD40552.1 MAG: hypothetical protein A2087_04650 [Spirochaetes bacterium GWD1_61_31]OHD44053.1 MAG: hypothetical protein A2Y35_01825 [Spirochaetes bacterium GWE1_60_18]OHD59088.1 MAG: hypothetical protein A2Y32_02545 [Spirochaetes bacterium GWF1_60_12]HAP44549.1 dihydroorotase [Spirochaetaceae bacterium]